MSGLRTYLDFNATAPLRPGARGRMVEVMDNVGNPSSIHAEGRCARAVVESARSAVAALAGTVAEAIIFTSGATEALSLVLSPGLSIAGDAEGVVRLLVGATEHPAVLQGHRFPPDKVGSIPVGRDGRIDLEVLEAMLGGEGRTLVALQAANSETGVIQPVAEAARLVHRHGGLLVCDGAQAAGRIDCRLETLGADAIVLSAHKLGGPQGVGALAVRANTVRLGPAMMRGGGQERGLRAGTENVAAIAGFGVAALEAASSAEGSRMAALHRRLEGQLISLVPQAVIFGAEAPRLPNTTAFAIPGVANEMLLIGLDLAGVAVSTGSACASGKVSRSHVLEAMRVDDHLIGGLIRVSLGWSSTAADVDRFIEALSAVLDRARARSLRPAA